MKFKVFAVSSLAAALLGAAGVATASSEHVGIAEAPVPTEHLQRCQAHSGCRQALVDYLAWQAMTAPASSEALGIPTPESNDSMCGPTGCMNRICYPEDSGNCQYYFCDRTGCQKVEIPQHDTDEIPQDGGSGGGGPGDGGSDD